LIFIGITGGIGAGKSEIISYIEKHYNAASLIADDIAKKLIQKNMDLYYKIVEEFGNIILDSEGNIDKKILAKIIFSDNKLRLKINSFIHPSVKKEVIKQYEKYKKENKIDFLFVEAALLIEDNYDKICDEIWYIYVSKENRRKRLKESRHYSDEKIDRIFASQLSEEEFKKSSDVFINNDIDIVNTYRQIDREILRVKHLEEMNG
jgi:hypothetical protein